MRAPFLSLLLSVFALSPLPAQFGDFGNFNAPDAGPKARASLIADVSAIEPGQTFRLGVRFQIEPQWHVYWVNYGDVGLPTSIEWKLPEGFTAGPLHWPAPERFETSGLVSYAYENEVVLYSEVTAPPQLDKSGITLAASADWLVCKLECIRESAELDLLLPVGGAEPSPHAPLFDAMERRTPAGWFSGDTPIPPESFAAEAFELTVEGHPAQWQPGEKHTLSISLTARPGHAFAVDSAQALYAHAEGPWQPGHAALKSASPAALAFELPLESLPQAEPGVAGYLHLALVLNQETGDEQVHGVSLPLRVAGDAAASETAPSETPAPTASETSPPAAAGDTAPGLSFLTAASPTDVSPSRGLFYYLVLAFLGGLILNIMPCVLPVISLKVMSFVNQSGDEHGRIVRMGLAFAAGVLASFAVLGAAVIALQAAGSQAGWGFQMQNPLFVAVLAAVVFAFALSLFGVFEVAVPGLATAKLGAASQREGYSGAFFNGVLATVLGTPCGAPFLTPAAAFAFTQSPAVIMAVFLTVGLGLASPYVLLTANPKWLRLLPRPGAWMETFKQLMGFLLLAMLVWLLWVLGSLMGNDGLAAVMLFLLLVAAACWWLGRAQRQARSAGIATLVAVALIVLGLAIPLAYVRSGAGPAASATAVESSPADGWLPFSVPAVERLVDDNRLVFLDFTADWCVTCQVNDQLVLSTDAVREAFARHDVAAVKADYTNYDATVGAVLAQFGSRSVPLYVILPPGRASEPIVLPTTITPGMVIDRLEQAAATQLAGAGRNHSIAKGGPHPQAIND